MKTLINLLLGFLLTVMIAAFLWLQFDLPQSILEGLFQEPLSAPPLLLVFGSLIHLVILRLFLMRFADTDPKDEAFPALFLGPSDPPHRALQWERTSAALGLGLPLVGFAWAWERFATKGEVWVKATGFEVGRWSRALECPLTFPPDIGLCRYGNIADRANPDLNGVDFMPFWQPLAMVMLSATVLALTAVVLYRLALRLPLRRRAVDRRQPGRRLPDSPPDA